jgi:regulator of replication initiation timing
VRIPALFLYLAIFLTPTLRAQSPGAQQDAEAAREKLLKAADTLDNIQANSETTKTSVDGMKTDVAALQAAVTKLQTDNAALRQQVTDLHAALDQYKAEQTKARQALIDNVADMIAAGKGSGATKPAKKKKEAPAQLSTSLSTSASPTESLGPVKIPAAQATATSLAPPPDTTPTGITTPPPEDDGAPASPPPKPQKGYYHVVASGETLTLICAAYRENGVNVSASAIRKANGLTEKSVLKPGQKLFIPKPGT